MDRIGSRSMHIKCNNFSLQNQFELLYIKVNDTLYIHFVAHIRDVIKIGLKRVYYVHLNGCQNECIE